MTKKSNRKKKCYWLRRIHIQIQMFSIQVQIFISIQSILSLTLYYYLNREWTESASSHGYFEAVVGALSAVMLLLIIAMVVIILMNHRKKKMQETIVTFSAPSVEASAKVWGNYTTYWS